MDKESRKSHLVKRSQGREKDGDATVVEKRPKKEILEVSSKKKCEKG
jgi:hypothetical protein